MAEDNNKWFAQIKIPDGKVRSGLIKDYYIQSRTDFIVKVTFKDGSEYKTSWNNVVLYTMPEEKGV